MARGNREVDQKTPTTHQRLTVMRVTQSASVPRHHAMKGIEMKVQEFQTSVITDTDTPRPRRGLGVLGKTAGCAQEGYVTADAYGPPTAGKYIHFWTLNIYTVFGRPRLPASAAAG